MNTEMTTQPQLQKGWLQSILGFNDDEDGMETLQVVLIVAVAAIILIVIKLYWREVKTWASGLMTRATTTADDAP